MWKTVILGNGMRDPRGLTGNSTFVPQGVCKLSQCVQGGKVSVADENF